MLVIRIRYRKLGGHIHCRLFTARAVHQTFAMSGNLIFSEDEWAQVRDLLSRAGSRLEFFEEEADD